MVYPFLPGSQSKPSRRSVIQAGVLGVLGLGMGHVRALRALAEGTSVDGSSSAASEPRAKAVIYIFLSGGLSQLDSFDPKPDAPVDLRGEFKPIATSTPGTFVCEHLPQLARRSHKWALLRSLSHPYFEHSEGHMVMLSGRTPLPLGFDPGRPRPTDWPSMAALTGALLPRRSNLPSTALLPEMLVHTSGRVIPGQLAGFMGPEHDPYLIHANRFQPPKYVHGAFPTYSFQRRSGAYTPDDYIFEAPKLSLPEGVFEGRFRSRLKLLREIDRQSRELSGAASVQRFGRDQEEVVSLLLDGGTHKAFDVHSVDAKVQDKYGRNSFGWSLLMARQLVEAGVSLVQVNLGNDESWDTHEANFYNLKNFLLPPTDQAVSALIDDLEERGMLDDTLVVMASEFGRSAKIFKIRGAKLAGRDHWGPAQSVLVAGGGARGGKIVGVTDRVAAYPVADAYSPEDLAATIYDGLGLPRDVVWRDKLDRPHHVYYGNPIKELTTG